MTERDIQRDIKTDRQKDRPREIDGWKKTGRETRQLQTYRKRMTYRKRETKKQTDKQTDRNTAKKEGPTEKYKYTRRQRERDEQKANSLHI